MAAVTAPPARPGSPEISVCIVNTNGRELLLGCLESVFRHPPSREFELLVLDNASDDGSAAAVRAGYGERVTLIELDRRRGKPDNDSDLMTRARGTLLPAAERGLAS